MSIKEELENLLRHGGQNIFQRGGGADVVVFGVPAIDIPKAFMLWIALEVNTFLASYNVGRNPAIYVSNVWYFRSEGDPLVEVDLLVRGSYVGHFKLRIRSNGLTDSGFSVTMLIWTWANGQRVPLREVNGQVLRGPGSYRVDTNNWKNL